MKLDWLKKSFSCSDARELRKLVDDDYPEHSVSGNVRSWACPGPLSTNGPQRCVNRPCRPWPGSMLCTWRIPAAAAAVWWIIWPEKGARSTAIGCATSCSAWVYGRSTRRHTGRFQETLRSDSPARSMSVRSRRWIRSGLPISPISRCNKSSSTRWRSWICSPETSSAGGSQAALTPSSVSRL